MQSPSLPYVAPFVAFLALLGLEAAGAMPPAVDYPLRTAVLGAILWLVSRRVIDVRARHVWQSLAFGFAVFALWIGPDHLAPGWRQHWLFTNGLSQTGAAVPRYESLPGWLLALRALRAVVLAPLAEELFWRGWLMRWLIHHDFEGVPLGQYTPLSFWVSAVLFASEHGRFWEVGLAAGIAYNWWMLHTRSLGDCILAHAVTNACLSGFVLAAGRWEYW